VISVELNDLTSSSYMAPETTNYNGVKKVWFSLSRLLVSRNDFFLVIKLLFLQDNGKHESSIIKRRVQHQRHMKKKDLLSHPSSLQFSCGQYSFVKGEYWSTWHERGTKTKSESLTGSNPSPLERWEGALYTELRKLMEVRSFNWVRCSGGHGSDSCRGLRFCLCSAFVFVRQLTRHISLPSLKFAIFFHLSIQFCLSFSQDDLLRERNGASCWLPKVRLTLTASTLG